MGYTGRRFDFPLLKDKHVIVDIRDGTKVWESEEHNTLHAFREFISHQVENNHIPDDSDMMKIIISDLSRDAISRAQEVGGIAGAITSMMMSMHQQVPNPYFTDEELTGNPLKVAGPYYTMMGCLHSKNMIFNMQETRNYFRALENTRELTHEEEQLFLGAVASLEFLMNPEFH